MVMKLSKVLIKPALQNHVTKNIQLVLNVSLISNKAPNMNTVICSGMNTASATNKILL